MAPERAAPASAAGPLAVDAPAAEPRAVAVSGVDRSAVEQATGASRLRQAAALLVLVAGVLALHLLFLGGLWPRAGAGAGEALRPPTLRVSLHSGAAADVAALAPPAPRRAAPAAVRALPPAAARTPDGTQVADAPAPGAPAPDTPDAPVTSDTRDTPDGSARVSDPVAAGPEAVAASGGPAADPDAAVTADEAAADGRGDQVLPVYPTRLPAATRLSYELRRGLLTGSGQLSWLPAADGSYEARLEGGAFGQALLAQASRGRIDAHGLAPERFTDRRRSRGEQAANFQRAAGKISFSGPSVVYPLPAGAQDRVSWLIQLGAVLAADPALQRAGSRLQMFVVGARGDADVWTIVVQGQEDIALPATGSAAIATLRVLRTPRRPFDTQAEAWLDPARGFLPVRLRLSTPDSGDATEFVLAPQ